MTKNSIDEIDAELNPQKKVSIYGKSKAVKIRYWTHIKKWITYKSIEKHHKRKVRKKVTRRIKTGKDRRLDLKGTGRALYKSAILAKNERRLPKERFTKTTAQNFLANPDKYTTKDEEQIIYVGCPD